MHLDIALLLYLSKYALWRRNIRIACNCLYVTKVVVKGCGETICTAKPMGLNYLTFYCTTTLNITTFSMITLSIKGLYVTLSICDIQHNNALPLWWLSLFWVSHFIYDYAECCYDEYRFVLYTIILIFVSYYLRVYVTVTHSLCLMGLLVWFGKIRLGWKWQTLWLKNGRKNFDCSDPKFSNVLDINRLG